MHAEEGYLAEAFEAGARGYLVKDSIDSELVEAVRAIQQGNLFVSSTLTSNVLEGYLEYSRAKRRRDQLSLLTDQEREVLCLVAEGKSNKEIARVLRLSQNTVETHRARRMDKLGLHNTAKLVLYAVRKGLVC